MGCLLTSVEALAGRRTVFIIRLISRLISLGFGIVVQQYAAFDCQAISITLTSAIEKWS